MGPLSKSTLAELLNEAPDAMLSIDTDDLIVMANLNAGRLFGYERSELIGTPVSTLMPLGFREIPYGLTGVPITAHRRGGGDFPAEISLSTTSTGSDAVMTVVTSRSEVRLTLSASATSPKRSEFASSWKRSA